MVALESPVVQAKAIKNAAELEGMKEAHLRDAVAICDFLCWLEEEVRRGWLGREHPAMLLQRSCSAAAGICSSGPVNLLCGAQWC